MASDRFSAGPAGSDQFVAVDFYDELCFAHNKPAMTVAVIRDMVRKFKEAGAAGLTWRLAPLGVAAYPSEHLTKITELDSVYHNKEMEKRQNGTPMWWRFDTVCAFTRTLESIDPNEEIVKACHEAGLQLYFWIDLFDEMLSKFLCAHPECLVHTSDGARYPGLRDYANETAVRQKLDELAELYKYRPDGLYLCSSCHARHLSFPEPDGAFGTLSAATFTKFLRRLKKECSPHGVKLMVMAPLGGSLNFNSPYFSDKVKYRIETDWKTWIDEGLADSLVLGDYELLWSQDGIWRSKGQTDIGPGHSALDVYASEFVKYNCGRSKLYFWCGLFPEKRAEFVKRSADEAIKHRLDGYLLHEGMLIENEPAVLSAMKDAKRRLNPTGTHPDGCP